MDRPAPPLSFRRRSLFLAVPFVVFFSVLGLVELSVRSTLPHVSSLDFFVTAPRQQAQFLDRSNVRVFEGDPLLFWRLIPNLHDVLWKATPVTTNAQGLRYDHAVGPKPAGAFRIVCAGDSVTFGYRVPRVYAHRQGTLGGLPYPALLEQWLRAANPGRTIEVIPLATPGYSSHQGLARLRRDLGWLQPDVVTACFGWNDIGLRAQGDFATMKTDSLSVTARGLTSHSQALIHASRWLRSRRGSPRPDTVRRVSRERYVDNMVGMARLARGHGARAVLIGSVYRDRVAHPPEGDVMHEDRAALRDAAREAGIPYLEVPELTEDGHPANARLFEEHIHPNHRGHRVLAIALLEFLRDQGLLAGLIVPKAPAAEHQDAAGDDAP
jgi:lysophospholipase L1-like esterase